MEWRLFGDLAERAGDRRVAVDADAGDEVGDALDELLADRPDLERRVLTDDGAVRDHVNVLRNGTNVSADEDGLSTTVEDGDELALFPPVSGG
jgi:molybdopterin synthase sulfur carrier subunit